MIRDDAPLLSLSHTPPLLFPVFPLVTLDHTLSLTRSHLYLLLHRRSIQQPQQHHHHHHHMANAASGMAVHDDCKLRFLELKAKRTYRFIVFKIEEVQKQVIVEKLGEPAQGYEDFTASLPADECRYAVYDFEYLTEGNVPKSRIFFIAWSPDTSRVRSKMIYASSKDRFKRELDGIQVELQATDPTEMGLDVFKSRAN
ncbi:hypothetical protein Fmac_009429 [Flemingia macrophylla]|uniref:ADF-H domain-containing protein n=1 Tax=Flemingia macrophylla TaxID=520843 RepID=A0ABD1N0A7_9FABA